MTRALDTAVLEVERHVDRDGWDQPPRLYALAAPEDLLRSEPQLAARLGIGEVPPEGLVPIEQEELPEFASLEELLAGIAWPPQVVGAAIVVERLVLPPEVEAQMPREEQAALRWLAAHPRREELRVAVGVLRDGSRACALRVRGAAPAGAADPADPADPAGEVLTGPDLVPGLIQALAATFAD